MGAEMVLAWMPAAQPTDERRAELHALIDGLAEPELTSAELGWLSDFLREALHEHIDLLPAPEGHRDVAVLDLPGMPYPLAFTGGLSWGDDPTEMFGPFAALGAIPPIVGRLEEWAREDARIAAARDETPTALQVLREWADDVRAAYGTGRGDEIDEDRLDWPDLAVTYRKAIALLGRSTHVTSANEET